MVDITGRLQDLMAKGFQFVHPRGPNGTIMAVVGVRAHHGVVDILQLLGEGDADAARVSQDEPDILFPRQVLWRGTGSADTVIDALLGLEDPGSSGAVARGEVRASRGCWVRTEPGRSHWMPAFS